MSWNHRVVRQSITRLGVQVEWHTIYEIHYWAKEGGEGYSNISGWDGATCPSGETVDELRVIIDLMQKCLDKPVLDLALLEGRPRGKPKWVSLIETLRGFEDTSPLPRAICEAISFVATAEAVADSLEATLRADGAVILEIGDGSPGSITFKGDGWIVYACGDWVGSASLMSEQPMQVLKEVLARAAHRPQPGTDPDTTTSDHTIRE